jgi:hypothetical protein
MEQMVRKAPLVPKDLPEQMEPMEHKEQLEPRDQQVKQG